MASDVKVKITGDVSDLEQAVKKSQTLLRKLGTGVIGAGRSLGNSFQRAGRAAASFASTLGGALVVTDVIGQAADFIKTELTEAWQEPIRAAQEAGREFGKAFESLVDFDIGGSEGFLIQSQGQLTDLARDASENVKNLESGLKALEGGFFKKASTFLKDFFSDEAIAQAGMVNGVREALESEKAILAIYQQQITQLEARGRLTARLSGRVSEKPGKDETAGIIPQASIDESVSGIGNVTEATREYERAKIDNIKATIRQREEERKLLETLDLLNQRTLTAAEDTQMKEGREAEEDRAAQRVRDRIATINAEFDESVATVDAFGTAAVGALADIVVGFENIKDIGQIVGNIVKQLASDLIVAAGKAAILSAFTGGGVGTAKGFGGFFKSFLGLTPFATGGIVTGPTPALVGEAGPEAIIPLNKLPGLMNSGGQVVFEIRGDKLVGVLNNTTEARGGAIIR